MGRFRNGPKRPRKEWAPPTESWWIGKECRGLTDLGWTRHLAREECVVDGTEYSEGGLVAFGPRDCYQLPTAMRAEPFSGQTVMGSPTR